MAATRATSKRSPQGVRQTRKSFLKSLPTPCCPALERPGQRGRTFEYPAWLILLIGVRAVKGREPTDLGLHRMACRFWRALCGREVRLPPIPESPRRARLQKIGSRFGTAPGYVVQSVPPASLLYGGQWR
jgi:hypothetical protein